MFSNAYLIAFKRDVGRPPSAHTPIPCELYPFVLKTLHVLTPYRP